jgi:hypothetical protein
MTHPYIQSPTYLILARFRSGTAWVERDPADCHWDETIRDIARGEWRDVVAVVELDLAAGRARDVTSMVLARAADVRESQAAA